MVSNYSITVSVPVNGCGPGGPRDPWPCRPLAPRSLGGTPGGPGGPDGRSVGCGVILGDLCGSNCPFGRYGRIVGGIGLSSVSLTS